MRWLSDELKHIYGRKVLKLSLSSGCTCPNRDGTAGRGGCAFCSEGGSGEFAAPFMPVDAQIAAAKKRVDAKFPKDLPESERTYIAYFQSFTNTYGDTARLKALYEETLRHREIAVLSVGTRPDALGPDKIAMLAELDRIKPVWVELGLQTIHEETARAMNRGYELPVFEKAYRDLKEAGLTVVVHLILGLPGETREMMLETAGYVGGLFRDSPEIGNPGAASGRDGVSFPDGIKLQMLQVLEGTALADRYLKAEKPFSLLTREEYVALVGDCLELFPQETVIHRLTGDPPKRLLIAPEWCTDKKRVLNALKKELKGRGIGI